MRGPGAARCGVSRRRLEQRLAAREPRRGIALADPIGAVAAGHRVAHQQIDEPQRRDADLETAVGARAGVVVERQARSVHRDAAAVRGRPAPVPELRVASARVEARFDEAQPLLGLALVRRRPQLRDRRRRACAPERDADHEARSDAHDSPPPPVLSVHCIPRMNHRDRAHSRPGFARTVPPVGLDGRGELHTADVAQVHREEDAIGSDRLSAREVLHVLARCVRVLGPARWHLVALCAGFAVVALALLPPSLIFLDLFWTRALQGEALPAVQAWLLGLDPAVAVDVPSLAADVRRSVALRTVLGGVVVAAIATPLFFALFYYQIWILQRVNQALRVEMLDRLQALSLRFHSEARVGDALYRLTQDSAMVTQLVDVLLLAPLYAIGTFLFAIAITTAIDPRMTLLLLAGLAPALGIARSFSSPMRRDFRRARESNAALTAQIQEVVSGIRVLKAYGASGAAQARFEAASREAFDAAFRARHRFAVYAILIFASVGLVLVAAAAWGAFEAREQATLFAARLFAATGVMTWSLGVFQFFKDRFGDGTNSIRRLFRTWARVQDVAVGLDRVFEVLDHEPEVRDAEDAQPLDGVREGLALPRRRVPLPQRSARARSRGLRGARRRDHRGRRPDRLGQEHAARAVPAPLRSRSWPRRDRRPRPARRAGREPAPARRDRAAGEPALRHHDPREHPLRRSERDGRRGARGRGASPAPTSSSRSCRWATTRRSASAAPSSRPASDSASRSRARC